MHARSARDLIKEYFGLGIPIIPREASTTVGTSAVGVGSYARARIAIGFGNAGNTAIVVGFSNSITSGSGWPIPAGAWLSFDWFDDGELVFQDMFAISSLSNQTLYVCESVLMGV